MYLSVNPAVLKSIFQKCSKGQLIMHGREIKGMLMQQPHNFTQNQRRHLFRMFLYCKYLYYQKP